MKNGRKNVGFSTTMLLVTILFSLVTTKTFAHDNYLIVDYDNCQANLSGDGLNEMWYLIDNGAGCYHLDNEIAEIKYYFSDSSPSGYTWTTDLSETEATQVKEAYAASMKKWNDVYFYFYDCSATQL